MSTMSYLDPHASVEERVEDLLARMNQDEKVAQLGCLWSTAFVSGDTFDPTAVVKVMPHGIGHVTRIGASTGLHPRESAAYMNELQKVAIEQTRLGIPIIVHVSLREDSVIAMRPFFHKVLDWLRPGTLRLSSRLLMLFASRCWPLVLGMRLPQYLTLREIRAGDVLKKPTEKIQSSTASWELPMSRDYRETTCGQALPPLVSTSLAMRCRKVGATGDQCN